ncbi:hypothetical protein JCM8547_002207 [Rhodosporidiobolus lusitaniae]
MLPFGARPTYKLSSSSPASLTADHVSPRDFLNVHDYDGEGREVVVEGTVAKVSIYNSKNLILHIGRVVSSTVEVFNSSNLTLVVGPRSPPSSDEEVSPLGVLQLDPTLSDVSIRYTHPKAIGSVVIAPLTSTNPAGQPTFGFSSLSLQAGNAEPFLLFAKDGSLQDPGLAGSTISPSSPLPDLARQLVLSYREAGWTLSGLARGEKDYPQLA